MARSSRNAAKLKKQKEQFEREMDRFPLIAATIAKNFFVRSFANQGFTDRRLVRWQRRRNDSDPGRAILVRSGRLRRSIRVSRVGRTDATIESNLPYSGIHNDGGRMGNGGTMPQRQFMGESYVLRRMIKARLEAIMRRIFRR